MDPTEVAAVAAGVTAAAAVVSAAVAFLLWRVTSKYTAETEAIAEANRRMAEANDRMAHANELLIEEMRADRHHFHFQRSVDAAHRLTMALTTAVRDWTIARDDASYTGMGQLRGRSGQPEPGLSAEEKRARVYQDWQVAVFNDRGAIEPDALWLDLARFTKVLRAATHDWEAVLGQIENDQSEKEAEHRRRTDNRGYRLKRLAELLRRRLEAHRRGLPVNEPILDRDYWRYWTLPSPSFDEELEGLDEEFEIPPGAGRPLISPTDAE